MSDRRGSARLPPLSASATARLPSAGLPSAGLPSADARAARPVVPPDIVLMDRVPQRLKARLARDETPMAGGLMRLGAGDAGLEALRLEIGVRLYGVAGAMIDLDSAVFARPRAAALKVTGDALACCRRLDAVLVIVSCRPRTAIAALLAPVLPARHMARRCVKARAKNRLCRQR